MHLCARSAAALPFGGRIDAFPFADRISVHLDDGAQAQKFSPAADLGAWAPGRHVYLCGPSGFMAWVIAEARAAGWPDAAIHTETFAAPVIDESENEAFDVRLARSGRTVSVAKDESLLDALNAAKCGVAASCEQGVCGSCLTRVLKGRPEHRDAFLSDVERAASDKMLVCVSRAKAGEVLTLDL
jgi:vanillate O-demethylase ferredoxin subunit